MNATNKKPAAVKFPIPEIFVTDYAKSEKVSSKEALHRARELEKFLFLCAHSSTPCVPAPAIDSIWHDFILHTRDYENFCKNNFGRFIHHIPERKNSKKIVKFYSATIKALQKTFGAVDKSLWPSSKQLVCGSCAHEAPSAFA